tara:strand:- start:4614 stop:4766 length:153 start_codon:yes stop_codon:yes gene_type:complete
MQQLKADRILILIEVTINKINQDCFLASSLPNGIATETAAKYFSQNIIRK